MKMICDEYKSYRIANQNEDGSRLIFSQKALNVNFDDSKKTIKSLNSRELDEGIKSGITEQLAYSVLMDSAAHRLYKGSRRDLMALTGTTATEAILFIRYLLDKELEKGFINEDKYKELTMWVEKSIQGWV